MVRPLIVSPARVRALIARLVLGASSASDAGSSAMLGAITLRPHQREAVERLRQALADHGGALLADDVGLGKTYVATALAREYECVLVVAPAALRDMWVGALRAAEVRAEFTTYTALGRGSGPAGPFNLVVLDEAHHARTPGTQRYAHLATLASGARILLLSATPIHNSRADLAALLALFLGARAWNMDDDALARHVVRRERSDVAGIALPDVAAERWLRVGDDDALLRAIVELPPPLPPSDAGDGGALLTWTLVRQWASSNGALSGALRRRLARAAVLDAALADGRHLTRVELGRWACGDDTVQLALPGLFAADVPEPAPLRATLAAHEQALRALLERVRRSDWTDVERARLLRELRSSHPGEKIVAFTQFVDTARTLFRHLRTDAGVAALTGRGAQVAGGALTRREAIARFAPQAAGTAPPRAAERIDLLITTDLLSEGVNLHDASVVVHLDLPWTPARLEQRVGRSRRMGARHARTTVYAFAPPASSELLLHVEERLRAKLRAVGQLVAVGAGILPASVESERARGRTRCDDGAVRAPSASASRASTATESPSATRRRELVLRALARWHAKYEDDPAPAAGTPIAAVVRAPCAGMLALVRDADGHHLLAALDDVALSDDPDIVLQAVRLADGERAPADGRSLRRAFECVNLWIARRSAMVAAGVALPLHAPARQRAMRRIAAITSRAPSHRRPILAPLATRARRAITAPYGIGAERALEELVSAEMPDDAWLRAVGELGERYDTGGRAADASGPVLTAVLILQPTPPRAIRPGVLPWRPRVAPLDDLQEWLHTVPVDRQKDRPCPKTAPSSSRARSSSSS
jgi:superfamily II DNA or RNA helicase